MSAYPTEEARPVPYLTTGQPYVDWSDRAAARAYLRSNWGHRLCTAHGATSAAKPARAYCFTSYHWLWKAFNALGVPHSETEEDFREKYISKYLAGVAEVESFWNKFLTETNDEIAEESEPEEDEANEDDDSDQGDDSDGDDDSGKDDDSDEEAEEGDEGEDEDEDGEVGNGGEQNEGDEGDEENEEDEDEEDDKDEEDRKERRKEEREEKVLRKEKKKVEKKAQHRVSLLLWWDMDQGDWNEAAKERRILREAASQEQSQEQGNARGTESNEGDDGNQEDNQQPVNIDSSVAEAPGVATEPVEAVDRSASEPSSSGSKPLADAVLREETVLD
ncbi:MAG: hypothetical protein Q9208_002889 [Pyrenodesmia sp. 3 TL-2023]